MLKYNYYVINLFIHWYSALLIGIFYKLFYPRDNILCVILLCVFFYISLYNNIFNF